jgi:hypothetical protein
MNLTSETAGSRLPALSTLNSEDEQNYKLNCNRGGKICYGASLRSNYSYIWGVSANGNQGCIGCCSTCGSD